MIESALVAAGTYGIVSAFVPLHYHWTAPALLPLALVALTATGYSLIIGGLTLVFQADPAAQRQRDDRRDARQCRAIPLIAVPGWMAGAGRAFPLTAGIASLYGVLLGYRPVTYQDASGGGRSLPLVGDASYSTAHPSCRPSAHALLARVNGHRVLPDASCGGPGRQAATGDGPCGCGAPAAWYGCWSPPPPTWPPGSLAAAALLPRPARGGPVTGCPGRLCPGPWLPLAAAYRASFSSPAR